MSSLDEERAELISRIFSTTRFRLIATMGTTYQNQREGLKDKNLALTVAISRNRVVKESLNIRVLRRPRHRDKLLFVILCE